jgi:CubicO group peptidase (beta-lactamase class C family)
VALNLDHAAVSRHIRSLENWLGTALIWRMWWFRNNAHNVFSARGVFGQGIYIDPTEMVIVRFASMPVAGNAADDPISLPFYDAVATELMKSR